MRSLEIHKGITRKVLLIGKFAIKVPRLFNRHYNFLHGCMSNWKERDFCKKFKDVDFENNKYEFVAPSYFCSWFGLVQIQARCKVNTRELTDEELEFFTELCDSETKPENFGYYKGKLVCLDYS